MPGHGRFTPHRMTADLRRQDAEHAVRSRGVIEQAGQVLRAPMADTFLGRKTFDPFPDEENDA